jgi:hypothetical protein
MVRSGKPQRPAPCKPEEHQWVVFSTALREGWLMLQCRTCGAHGTVDDPSKEEWSRAFHAPSAPYAWEDDSRVTLHPEKHTEPDYWTQFINLEIGLVREELLSLFDGASPDLEIIATEPNVDSNGRILILKNGAAVNQVKEDGRWRCIAFCGPIPQRIVDAYFRIAP